MSLFNIIQKFDLFGFNCFVFFKSKHKYKTTTMGLISLFLIIYIIYNIILNTFKIFNEEAEAININYYKKYDSKNSKVNI